VEDPDTKYHEMRANGATPHDVFRAADADGGENPIAVIRRVFELGFLDAKEVSLQVTASPAELAAWRAVYRCPESSLPPWEREYQSTVDPSMLTLQTSVGLYFRAKLASKGSLRRVETRQYWEKHRDFVAGKILEGDELWLWQNGEDFGSGGGIAIVRRGEIAHAWIHWIS